MPRNFWSIWFLRRAFSLNNIRLFGFFTLISSFEHFFCGEIFQTGNDIIFCISVQCLAILVANFDSCRLRCLTRLVVCSLESWLIYIIRDFKRSRYFHRWFFRQNDIVLLYYTTMIFSNLYKLFLLFVFCCSQNIQSPSLHMARFQHKHQSFIH